MSDDARLKEIEREMKDGRWSGTEILIRFAMPLIHSLFAERDKALVALDAADQDLGERFVKTSDQLSSAQAEIAGLRQERDDLRKENYALRCTPEPREYDLAIVAEWLRLLREVRGYMHTCWRQHDGGDRKGRDFAQAGLEKMEKQIATTLLSIREGQ